MARKKTEQEIENEYWNTATISDVVRDKNGKIIRFENERKF